MRESWEGVESVAYGEVVVEVGFHFLEVGLVLGVVFRWVCVFASWVLGEVLQGMDDG